MTDVAEIERRTKLITQAAANAVIATRHVDSAISHARAARADLGVLHELETARASLDRAIKRAELQRLRLLRKADRQGATP